MASTFIPSSFSQTPGLYQSFEKFIDIGKTNFIAKLERLQKSPDQLRNLGELDKVDFDPDFLNHILFYTPTRYAMLAQKDKCSFYDLVLAELIKDHQGPIEYFIIRYTPKKGKARRAYVTKNIFMEKIGSKQCPNAMKFQSYFTPQNFSKTIKTIKLSTPTSLDNCYEVHKSFSSDYKTPYLCSIYEKIGGIRTLDTEIRNTPKSNYRKLQYLNSEKKTAQSYLKLMDEKGLDYLKNLCTHIDKPKMFCNEFFQKNFWRRIANGEKSAKHIESLCYSILKIDPSRLSLSQGTINSCIRKINQNKELCHYANTKDASLVPKPNCENISKAMNYSRLYSEYDDCPGETGNQGLVNVNRILQHVSPSPQLKSSHCSLNAANRFVSFNEEVGNNIWKVFLCYDDKIEEKEICLPSLTGNVEGSPYSMGTVVSKILEKTKAAPKDLECKVVSDKEFNSALLKFKSGCWVISNSKNCNAISCQHKIIWREKIITHIKQKQSVLFDYFANSFKNERYSQANLIKNNFNLTEKKVLNVTSLKNIFSKNPKAIVHGIGCAEDLLPTFFKKYAFNQCSPLTFIVDGYVEDTGYISLIVRSSLDDLHAPRIISWSQVFSAVKSYQLFQPINDWGLYAIY